MALKGKKKREKLHYKGIKQPLQIATREAERHQGRKEHDKELRCESERRGR